VPPLSDLIWDQATLERVVEAAVAAGIPRQELIIVEYAAEPIRAGLLRKFSVFRIGDQILALACVQDTSWIMKPGRHGVADEAICDEELEIVRENRFVERALWPWQSSPLAHC